MTAFGDIFGNSPPPLGDSCRPDYDQAPRPDIDLTRQRARSWQEAEDCRKAGNIDGAIRAALLVLAYDGVGWLRPDQTRTRFRREDKPPAYGVFRSLRVRLNGTSKAINDVKPLFDAEAAALLQYLPPLVEWPDASTLWDRVIAGLREVE